MTLFPFLRLKAPQPLISKTLHDNMYHKPCCTLQKLTKIINDFLKNNNEVIYMQNNVFYHNICRKNLFYRHMNHSCHNIMPIYQVINTISLLEMAPMV